MAAGSAPYALSLTVTGRTSTGAQFYSAVPVKFVVMPAPRVSSLSVNALNRGATQVPVEITGEFTQWNTLGLPVVSLGEGVTLTELARSPLAPETRLTGKLTVAANAPVGPRTLTAAQGSVVASLANALTVLAAPPVPLTGVSPGSVIQGATATIDLYGSGFTTSSQAYFGDGITVNQMVYDTPSHIQAVVQANPYAYPGPRPVTVVTGGSFATGLALQVIHKPVSLKSVYPASLPQGQSDTVTIEADGTNFLEDATRVSFTRPGSGGIVVGDVRVISPTKLRAEVAVAPGTPLGAWNITVATDGEMLNAGQFTVTGGTPIITQVNPPSGMQGAATFPVTLTAAFTTFSAGTTIACAGGGLTIGATTLVSPTSVRVNVAINSLAAVGARACTAKTGGTIVPFTFQVNAASGVQLLSLSPGSAPQGSSVPRARILGLGTNFVRGTTVVSLRHNPTGSALTIPQPVTVLSLNEIEMAIVIPAEALVGSYHLQVQTGGEVLSLPDAFRVVPATPQVSVTPSSLPQQAEQTLVFNGTFTNWGPGTAIDPSPTPDIEYLSALQVQSATRATLRVRIRPRANFAFPPNPYLLVLRTTVDSPFGLYQEAVGAGFSVARGPARILSVDPPSGNSGARVPMTIWGEFTSFQQGLTTVVFGCGAQVLTNPATVVGPTQLRVEVQLPIAPELVSNCPIRAITEGEQADGSFELRGIAPPVISSVTPNSAAQGETRSIVILGTNTNWAPGTTVNLGVGVSVIPTSITPTRIDATVSVVPTTATGSRPVTVTTGAQVLNYGVPTPFAVTPGPAEIRSLTVGAIRQGQNLQEVVITGRATNFLQGSSNASFGSGITVNSFTVQSATQATAIVSASLSAALGLRTVAVTTDGEVASISTAFSVTEKQPVILSVSPVSAQQGATVDVTVLGEATSFSPSSVLSLGPDIDFLNVVGTPMPTRAVFRMRVGPLAITAPLPHRAARVTTGTEVVELANAFFATPGAAAISSVTPGTATQGQNAEILIRGQNTKFAQSITTASINTPLGTAAINIGEVLVDQVAQEVRLRFSVPPNAATGLR
ncbi:MAG: IPT/TIG domain-containing protein, partial [Acidobacteria bacterium]|nr:IPT/TIG domain-containing protein [Acidobacteriota bacterium]